MTSLILRRIAIIASVTALLWFAMTQIGGDAIVKPPHVAPPTAEVAATIGDSAEILAAQATGDLVAFLDGVSFSAWVEGVNRAEEEARQLAALEAARRSVRSRVAPSGGCEGFAIPGYIVWRESHCDYGAINYSGCGGQGCYGAYQIHALHWSGGLCSDLTWTSPSDQDECASRLWNGGAGASHWGG